MTVNPSFLAFLALISSVPYFVVRKNRLAYAAVDLTTYALLVAAWFVLPGIGVQLHSSLYFAVLVVAKLAAFFAFVYFVEPWTLTAVWAGLFAGALYLVLVPHVLQWPIDGDEPYYLLVTESLVHDRDVDLRNQYARIGESATRRPDLKPQIGDPTGPLGEQYSRTEPFFSVLLIPGYLLFGLPGAVGTVAIFGGLLVWSTMRLLDEEGFTGDRRLLCGAFAMAGPPVLFYATRLWPEVPAAFFVVQAVRAMRSRSTTTFALSIAALSLLKLRFILIAAVLLMMYLRRAPRRWQIAALGAAVILVPLAIAYLVTGGIFSVHQPWELRPAPVWKYARGAFGLLLDAQTGILFQAPFFIVSLVAIVRWREVTPAARIGLGASIIYLLLLLPREEWHGGWSPPLRYLVVLVPILCLVAAALVDRVPRTLLVAVAIATAVIVIHGLAFPWRLFHIANGESVLGETLSTRFHADFSRMLPSFIRPNRAAWIASIAAIIALLSFRVKRGIWVGERIGVVLPSLFALLLALWFRAALRPGSIVHFEDAHVQRTGGELYPHQFTVARFLYTGGWTVRPGDSLRFLYHGGESRLRYVAHAPAGLLIDGNVVALPRTQDGFGSMDLVLGRGGEHTIQGLAGEVILDRIEKR